MLLMVGRTDGNRLVRLLDFIPAKGMTICQLSRRSGINRKTVRKYVHLIMQVQNSPRLELETVGMRVLVRRENGNRTNTADE